MLNYTMCKDNKKSTDNIQQTTDFLIENGKLKMESYFQFSTPNS